MPIKKIIYQSILLLWLFKPIQKIMKWGIAKSPFLKKKLYQDLRFKGILRVKIHGKPFLLINPGNTTIENEIYWNGLENGWEKNTIKLWSEFVINSKNILDIGANSGLFSMISATLNPDAKIFAFEPVQRTSELLKTNVDINKFSNIIYFPHAVSNKDDVATFYDVKTPTQYSASLNANMLLNDNLRITYDVNTIRLDNLVALQKTKVDLIKLDVEMHEPEALQGMGLIIERDRPILIIEILNTQIAKEVLAKFSNIDYLSFSISEESFELKYLNEDWSQFGGNFLFLPKEKASSLPRCFLTNGLR